MTSKSLLTLPVLFVCLAVFIPTATATEDLTAQLQDVLEVFHSANPIAPGIVVWVESPPRNLDWAGVTGTVDRDSVEPLTAAHTFRIASNTKTYVAAAVLRLAELGRLSLDDPLGGYLSPDQYDLLAGDGYDLEAMTIGQVLAHTSGLFEHPADPRYEEAILENPHHRWTRIEQITRCVEWGDPVGAPGEKFSYSDTGYIILGGIIERLTDLNLGAAVRSLLGFGELGLHSTYWEILEEDPAAGAGRAHQYYGDLDTFDWNPSLDLYGGGGLICDARDLGMYVRMLMQGQVLDRDSSLAAMTGEGTHDYRLGLICTELGGYLGWGHTGFWNTFAFYVPSLDVTVSGCILNHHADIGRELAKRLVAAIAPDSD